MKAIKNGETVDRDVALTGEWPDGTPREEPVLFEGEGVEWVYGKPPYITTKPKTNPESARPFRHDISGGSI